MADDPPPYEREKLYREVWEEPVLKVAKRYRCSDVYLARICRKMQVPLPGRGYWAKPKERRPARPPLPELTPQEARRVRVIGDRRSAEQRRYQEAAESAKRESAAAIVVPEELTDPHELVAKAERRLRRAKVIRGVVSGRRYGLLDISVAPDSLDRALRIFDALFKALPPDDFTVSLVPPPKDPDNKDEPDEFERVTQLLCRGEPLLVRLYEEMDITLDPKPYRLRIPLKPNGHSASSRTVIPLQAEHLGAKRRVCLAKVGVLFGFRSTRPPCSVASCASTRP